MIREKIEHLISEATKNREMFELETLRLVKAELMKYDSKVEGEMRGGLFFYRCRIDEVDYYVYLTEADGIYKQERVPVENTVIKETKEQPRVVKSNTYVQSGIQMWIRFKDNPPKKTCESDTLYVPEGTVSNCTKFEVF